MQTYPEIFITKKPKSEILEKHIAFYYFHQYFEENQIKKIVFYPNIINAVTIYKNSYLIFKQKNISITKKSPTEEYNLFYAGIRKLIGVAEMETPFVKLELLSNLWDFIILLKSLIWKYFQTNTIVFLQSLMKIFFQHWIKSIKLLIWMKE